MPKCVPTKRKERKEVELIRYSKSQCSAQYPPHRHLLQGYHHSKQMCCGDTVKNTCEGDSGGPLQAHSALVSCMFVILGVTSFREPCGYANNFGMYTRVSYYVPWIENIVWP